MGCSSGRSWPLLLPWDSIYVFLFTSIVGVLAWSSFYSWRTAVPWSLDDSPSAGFCFVIRDWVWFSFLGCPGLCWDCFFFWNFFPFLTWQSCSFHVLQGCLGAVDVGEMSPLPCGFLSPPRVALALAVPSWAFQCGVSAFLCSVRLGHFGLRFL